MTLVLCLDVQPVRTWARRDSTCIKNITLFWHSALSELAVDERNHCPVPAVSLVFWWWQSAASLYTSRRGLHLELCDSFFLASKFPPWKMKVMEIKSFFCTWKSSVIPAPKCSRIFPSAICWHLLVTLTTALHPAQSLRAAQSCLCGHTCRSPQWAWLPHHWVRSRVYK